MNLTQAVVSVNALARDTHEKWLASGDRRYSPFNRPWHELTPEHRTQVSRQARNCIDLIRASGQPIVFHDEYAQPSPGDIRWSDPEATTVTLAYTPGPQTNPVH